MVTSEKKLEKRLKMCWNNWETRENWETGEKEIDRTKKQLDKYKKVGEKKIWKTHCH